MTPARVWHVVVAITEETRTAGAPGGVAALTAEPAGDGAVSLQWAAPAKGGNPYTRFFVLCLRIDGVGRESLVATRFLPAHQRAHVESRLLPGTYRFEVGALGPTGSGPRARISVAVDAKGVVHVREAAVTATSRATRRPKEG